MSPHLPGEEPLNLQHATSHIEDPSVNMALRLPFALPELDLRSSSFPHLRRLVAALPIDAFSQPPYADP